MQEIDENIIGKDSNLISRNAPLALIVGAAGFLGSHLAEKLLSKNIQVIGVDDFSTGRKENLEVCVKDKKFHFINGSGENFDIDTSRLDYIFIVAEGNWDLNRILAIAKKYHSKVVLVSSIELYDRKAAEDLAWFKESESKLAKFAGDNNLNARVVRLGAVFGPRMHFREDDPTVKLIQASLLDELQKESMALNFSSRALFVDDAVSLIIKSMLAGSTAQKIFDGVNSPIKVSEIKQILLDPIWHENRGFGPSELPPWPTPNLENTKKHLSWKPETNLVHGLKLTLQYFKEREIKVPEIKLVEKRVESNPPDKFEAGDEFKERVKEWKGLPERQAGDLESQKIKPKKAKFSRQTFLAFLSIVFIFYALVYPIAGLAWNYFNFKNNLERAKTDLNKGALDESLADLKAVQGNLSFIKDLISSYHLGLQLGILNPKLDELNNSINIYEEYLISTEHVLSGSKALYHMIRVISGEAGSLKGDIDRATSELESGYIGLSQLVVEGKLVKDDFFDLASKNKVAAQILPQFIPQENKKGYLIIIEDNRELRPTGGKIVGLIRIDFENGKFTKIESLTADSLDKGFLEIVTPPKEIKLDLRQSSWKFSDSNFEADFPTSARQMAWFYTKAFGKTVDGVITLDLRSLERLLEVIGPVNLKDQNLSLNSDNFLKVSENSKIQVKVAEELIKKILFIPNLNWPGVTNWFSRSFEEKHILIYSFDNKLFSKLLADGFSGALPRPGSAEQDLIYPVESNVGGSRANYYLDRRYDLQTLINKEGRVNHTLKIAYTNQGAQKYKSRMRIYFPSGTKLTRASWGEGDLLKDTISFTDYGRGGYSFAFEVLPKDQRTLILEFQPPFKIDTKKGLYSLDFIKQAGTDNDPLRWHLKGVKEQTLTTDLVGDKHFEVGYP